MTRVELLKGAPLFAGLTDSEVEAIARDFTQRQFGSGETIVLQGDPGEVFYLIESGQVRIFVEGAEGQETSVILYGPREVFGELSVIDGLPRSASAVAIEHTTAHVLTGECFRQHLQRYPQLAFNFLNALSIRLRYSTEQVESLALLDVPGRLARKLLELAKTHGAPEPAGALRINLTLTQSELASLTGTTRESVNKALNAFRRQGLIALTAHGAITLLDPDGLRRLSS
jgi:CRP-like cAMP-binding protein